MDIERLFGWYLTLFIQSYNPGMYAKLLNERMRTLVKFGARTLLIGVILFIVTFIPVSYSQIGSLQDHIDDVKLVNVSAQLESDEPVQLLSFPLIVLDPEGNSSDADVMLSREGLRYPKYLLFGSNHVSWSGDSKARDQFLIGAVIFLLPSILFWFALATLFKLALAMGLLLLLGYYVPRLWHHRLRFDETIKLLILASPSVIFIGIGLYPLAPRVIFWWGLLVTSVVYFLGVALMAERRKTR